MVGHDLLDRVHAADLGAWASLWRLLHERGVLMSFGRVLNVIYPIVPWPGVMAVGYAFGTILMRPAAERRRLFAAPGRRAHARLRRRARRQRLRRLAAVGLAALAALHALLVRGLLEVSALARLPPHNAGSGHPAADRRAAVVPSPCSATPISPSRTVTNRL